MPDRRREIILAGMFGGVFSAVAVDLFTPLRRIFIYNTRTLHHPFFSPPKKIHSRISSLGCNGSCELSSVWGELLSLSEVFLIDGIPFSVRFVRSCWETRAERERERERERARAKGQVVPGVDLDVWGMEGRWGGCLFFPFLPRTSQTICGLLATCHFFHYYHYHQVYLPALTYLRLLQEVAYKLLLRRMLTHLTTFYVFLARGKVSFAVAVYGLMGRSGCGSR